MFNIGGGELLVIALIALIVLGPQRLPDAARTVGKVMGDLRRISSGFQQEIRDAFDASDAGTDSDTKDTPRRREATALATTVAETEARATDAVADTAEDADTAEPVDGAGDAGDEEVPAPEPQPSGPAGEPDASSTVAPAVAAALDEIVAPLPPARASASTPPPNDHGATAPAPADRGDDEGLDDHRAAS
jgi:sec-independent protein translocase protein TatB